MSSTCEALHKWVNGLPAFHFPFDARAIPLNGIYILFEKGQTAHECNRIVRVGTHTGDNQLQSRLKQHFMIENKDRSIFRKNIGRALLNKGNDAFLAEWEYDRTTRGARIELSLIDADRQRAVERQVSEYIRSNFSFVILRVEDKRERLQLESKLISTVSHCEKCRPSEGWLGLSSPKRKVRESGLWLVNELYKQPLSNDEFLSLQRLFHTGLELGT